MVKVAPWPGSLASVSMPPAFSTIFLSRQRLNARAFDVKVQVLKQANPQLGEQLK